MQTKSQRFEARKATVERLQARGWKTGKLIAVNGNQQLMLVKNVGAKQFALTVNRNGEVVYASA